MQTFKCSIISGTRMVLSSELGFFSNFALMTKIQWGSVTPLGSCCRNNPQGLWVVKCSQEMSNLFLWVWHHDLEVTIQNARIKTLCVCVNADPLSWGRVSKIQYQGLSNRSVPACCEISKFDLCWHNGIFFYGRYLTFFI